MEAALFIDLDATSVILLILVGFVGGMVSGFIGSGGAFVLTPAMMTLGAPGIVAVASNICHKFPKALVGAIKRHKYGQVDVKLGLIVGVFAEAGVLYGKHLMTDIKNHFGLVGTDLYVSVVFIVVLAIVGGFVLRDYRKLKQTGHDVPTETPRLARWVQSVHIPGTMVHFPSVGARVSLLFVIPIGFFTGMLAATIAVGGFIGVPAMIYILGLPALMASATELVVAFVMGLGGTIFYGLEGAVDVRLSMLILLGSLFGIQLGAISTTYVKDYQVKLVMAVIMLTVLFSRFFYIPGYLSELQMITPLDQQTAALLKQLGDGVLALALLSGAATVLISLFKGMAEYRRASAALAGVTEVKPAAAPAVATLNPASRFERILLATDGSEYSEGAIRVATGLARRFHAKLYVTGIAVHQPEFASTVPGLEAEALARAQRHVEAVAPALEGIDHELVVREAPDPYRGICDAAEELRADVIVMGRRGRRGLARNMLGDATAKVIGHAPCSVIVAPRAARAVEQGVLVATDGSRYGDAAAWTAGQFARQAGLPLTVLSVVLPSHSEARRQEAAQAVERVRREFGESRGIVAEGRPEQVIVEQAREVGADLIVLGTHGRTGMDRLLMGSVAERVIGMADGAVMAVKG